MLALDNTLLTLLFNPQAKPPEDPNTGAPIDRLEDKLALLLQTWKDDKEEIIIPTPALAEFLIILKADGPQYLDAIHKSGNFQVRDFDEMAAVELSARYYDAFVDSSKGEQKRLEAVPIKSKVKFDKQIVAIAQVNGAKAIYSDDKDIYNYAKQYGISVIRTWELVAPPLPPEPVPTLFDHLPLEKKEVDEQDEQQTNQPSTSDDGRSSGSDAPDETRTGNGQTVGVSEKAESKKPKAISEDG